MSGRPCAELDREIESVSKNIAHANKDLKRPDLDNDQRATLQFSLEGYREQLAQLQEQRANCS
jgi:hypothetical protein